MTQEEKAKRYDEALEMAKKLIENEETNVPVFYVNNIKDIFPELKESIDERIKKVIKQVLSESTTEKDECYLDNGVTQREVFAWLDEQGEHANFRNKIQIGDKVTRNKDGVLVNLSQLNRVAKKDEKQCEQPKKHDVCDNCDQQGCCVSPCPMKLVEKHGEQKQELLTKEKALENSQFVEQKSAEWTAEDKSILFCTISDLKFLRDIISKDPKYAVNIIDIEREINWLKSLKDRVQPQPKQEWSEEVEAAISLLKDIAEEQEKDYCPYNANNLRKAAQYLETCRPQSQWKPSDEQIKALDFAVDCIVPDKFCFKRKALKELYQDLKKLKGEE